MRSHKAVRVTGALALVTLVSMLLLPGIASAARPVKSGNGWSGVTVISPTLQPDPTRGSQLIDLATNATGASVAAWDQFTYSNGGGATIGVATQSAGGAWSAPLTVSGTAGFSMTPRVAIAADGTTAVSWIAQDPAVNPSPQQRVQVAVKSPGASSWTTTTLASGPVGGVSITESVPLAFDANGALTAAWTMWSGSHNVMQSATWTSGGGWSSVVDLAPGLDGIAPTLAVDGRGDAVVAFAVTPAPGTNMPNSGWVVTRSGSAGSWSAPTNVTGTVSSSVGYVSGPQVAIDANGLATLIWMGSGVQGVRQTSATSWTAPATVIGAPNQVSSFTSFDLAVDNAGNAVVAASVFDATINVDRASIWVSRGSPSGGWSSAQRITDPTVPVDAYAANATVSPDGTLAFVGWIDHYHGVVQVSKLVNGSWAAATTIGRGVAFSSFQDMLRLEAGSGTSARAIWKEAKGGILIDATSYRG